MISPPVNCIDPAQHPLTCWGRYFRWRSMVLVALIGIMPSICSAEDDVVLQGEKSDFRGYVRYDHVVDGCRTIVVAPRLTMVGRPWVWRAEFFDAFPQVDLALLERGFHLVYIDVGNTFGCPDAMRHWDAFYKYLTESCRLSRKPVLEGLSRGGLYCFNWAADNADHVACILSDNAVMDFKCWPAGKGRAKGSPGDWMKLIADYHFASEAEALTYPKNPIDNLTSLARAQVPLFFLCNDADDIVPYEENSGIVKERYQKLGGHVEVLFKHHLGHHPHGMADPTPVVDFILRQTLPKGSPVVTTVDEKARHADAFVNSIGINVHLAYDDTSYRNFAEIVRPRLKELGIRSIRDHCPSPGHDQHRTRLKELAADGIRSLLICAPHSGTLEQIVQSLQTVSASVEGIEGPNEPDGEGLDYRDQTFPESARTYQADLFAAIKQDPATKSLPVVASAMSNPENAVKVGSFGPSMELSNTHSYADGGPPGYQWDWYLNRSRIQGDRPIVATETGYHTAINHQDSLWIPGVSEEAAGKYISRLFPEYFTGGISKTYLYELLDERDDPSVSENNFGILRFNGQPKPAFHAIKNMIALLDDRGPGFAPRGLRYDILSENAFVKHLLLQKRNGQFSLLLWQNTVAFDRNSKRDVDVKAQRVTVQLPLPAKDAKAYLPLRGAEPVAQLPLGKELTVDVPDHLLILQFTLD